MNENANSKMNTLQVTNNDYRMAIQFLSYSIFIFNYLFEMHSVTQMAATGLVYWFSVLSANLDREVGEKFTKPIKIWLLGMFIFLILALTFGPNYKEFQMFFDLLWFKIVIGVAFSLNVFILIFLHPSLISSRMVEEINKMEEEA